MHIIRLFLATIAMLLLAALPVACSASPPAAMLASSGRLKKEGEPWHCTATAYGHAILTTKHCLEGQPEAVIFRGKSERIREILSDGGEGIIIVVENELGPALLVGPPPKAGDIVWLVGEAGGLEGAVRSGMIAGYKDQAMLIDCRCWKGDSGAGVFNDSGQLVGIYFGNFEWPGPFAKDFDFPDAYPLAFTPEQWAKATQP
jgi:hypothetical protein